MHTDYMTIQYLEDSQGISRLDQAQVISRLRAAAESLPISHLLIGWQAPQSLLEACRLEADKIGLRFLRWQPSLTTDKGFQTDPSWFVEGLAGHKVQGYKGLSEFTFFCPNHPAVQEAVLGNMEAQIRRGIYQGFFLDRIRLPSPATNPGADLACFCEHCCQKAVDAGIDLLQIRQLIRQEVTSANGSISLVKFLLSRTLEAFDTELDQALYQLISFRKTSISDFLAMVSKPLREAHMEIGLDGFSPSLAAMVGQDLYSMSQCVDWIKLMTYAHTYAPAGLPYELSGLIHFLVNETKQGESRVIRMISGFSGLPLPESCHVLEAEGLAASALEIEVQRGIMATSKPILAGIELVDLAGVTHLSHSQIRSDLVAIKRTDVHGLAISWDLLHIPQDRLELIAQTYLTG